MEFLSRSHGHGDKPARQPAEPESWQLDQQSQPVRGAVDNSAHWSFADSSSRRSRIRSSAYSGNQLRPDGSRRHGPTAGSETNRGRHDTERADMSDGGLRGVPPATYLLRGAAVEPELGRRHYVLHYYAEDCAGTQELSSAELASEPASWFTTFYTYPFNLDTAPPTIAASLSPLAAPTASDSLCQRTIAAPTPARARLVRQQHVHPHQRHRSTE